MRILGGILLSILVSSVILFSQNNKIHNITLPMAISIGIKQNLELMKKRLEVGFKKMAANETYRAFLPQVSFSFNRAVTIRNHQEDSRQYRYELSLDQLLFDWGKTKNTRNLAIADWKIAVKMLQTQERSIRLSILTSFAKVIGGRETVRIYKDFIKASKKELQLANLEVRLGTTTILDRDEVATRYESAKLELLKSEESYFTAGVAFRQLLRLNMQTKIQLIGNPGDGFSIVPLLVTENTLFAYAKKMRVDFVNSVLQYRKAIFEYKTIKRSWLPDISLNSKFFLSGPSLRPNEKGYSVFLKFSFPFFGSPATSNSSVSGGKEKTASTSLSISPFQDISYIRKLAQIKTQAYFARLQKQELPENVRREIRLAVAGLKLATRRFKIREKQLQILKKRIKILELKIKLGESKRLDLAKARIELYKALIGRIEEIISYINTAFKLETTVGLMPGTLKLFRSNVFSFTK